jgi:hypothetical protein
MNTMISNREQNDAEPMRTEFDTDGDGLVNLEDNCPSIYNPKQLTTDCTLPSQGTTPNKQVQTESEDVESTNRDDDTNSNLSKGTISNKTDKYECIQISEQETKCSIIYNDIEEPAEPSSSYALADLKQYALDLINKDRNDYSVQPVALGTNNLADDHANYLLEEQAIYHCRTTSYMGQNVAVEGYEYNVPDSGIYCPNNNFHLPVVKGRVPEVCKGAYVYCEEIDPQRSIATAQYNMMYDDADSNWGHRDNIVDKQWNCVSIGIAFDKYFFVLVQDFETWCRSQEYHYYDDEPSPIQKNDKPIKSHGLCHIQAKAQSEPTYLFADCAYDSIELLISEELNFILDELKNNEYVLGKITEYSDERFEVCIEVHKYACYFTTSKG